MLQITFCPQIQQEKSLKWPKNLNGFGYGAEIFGIFYSQWDYEMMNISRILKFLTWHGFNEFGWHDADAIETDRNQKQVIFKNCPH